MEPQVTISYERYQKLIALEEQTPHIVILHTHSNAYLTSTSDTSEVINREEAIRLVGEVYEENIAALKADIKRLNAEVQNLTTQNNCLKTVHGFLANILKKGTRS